MSTPTSVKKVVKKNCDIIADCVENIRNALEEFGDVDIAENSSVWLDTILQMVGEDIVESDVNYVSTDTINDLSDCT